MENNIRAYLAKLDPGNEDHWTNAGLPSVAAVSKMAGEVITRAQIAEAWPGFDREAANAALAGDAPIPGNETQEPSAAPQEAAVIDHGNDAGGDKDGPAVEVEEVPQEPDAIAMFEAAVSAAQSPRFARNAEFQALVRQYQVQQHNIKAWQDRLDRRATDKAAR